DLPRGRARAARARDAPPRAPARGRGQRPARDAEGSDRVRGQAAARPHQPLPQAVTAPAQSSLSGVSASSSPSPAPPVAARIFGYQASNTSVIWRACFSFETLNEDCLRYEPFHFLKRTIAILGARNCCVFLSSS